ncbi:MAG: aminoacyl-tRNA hydrolase [Rhodospirillales bacterium]|nr:aminoacyl-tRNA hydrolase [Rhodospirillales bacterium]
MITIDGVEIDDAALEERFVRASGPGGQNVNKVSSAVQLRFDVRLAQGLGDNARVRLRRLAGRRLNRDDVIVIEAQRRRTQEGNRADALSRLAALIGAALAPPPPPRRASRPGLAARRRRLEEKAQRAKTKQLRTRPLAE